MSSLISIWERSNHVRNCFQACAVRRGSVFLTDPLLSCKVNCIKKIAAQAEEREYADPCCGR